MGSTTSGTGHGLSNLSGSDRHSVPYLNRLAGTGCICRLDLACAIRWSKRILLGKRENGDRDLKSQDCQRALGSIQTDRQRLLDLAEGLHLQ